MDEFVRARNGTTIASERASEHNARERAIMVYACVVLLCMSWGFACEHRLVRIPMPTARNHARHVRTLFRYHPPSGQPPLSGPVWRGHKTDLCHVSGVYHNMVFRAKRC